MIYKVIWANEVVAIFRIDPCPDRLDGKITTLWRKK